MSNSVRPHRQQPTRLPRPWDSLGKNTGVGCHFLFQCMKVKSESEVAQLRPTLSARKFLFNPLFLPSYTIKWDLSTTRVAVRHSKTLEPELAHLN